jgi:hypothetical protein
MSTSDFGGFDVNYFKISIILSQNQLMTHSQYFIYPVHCINNCYWREWLGEGSSHFKYVELLISTKIEAIVINNP